MPFFAKVDSTFWDNHRSRPLSKLFALTSLRWVSAIVISLAPGFGQTLLNLGTQGRNADFSSFPSTRPVSVGTASPATCQLGQLFFNSTAAPGANLFACTAPNTWAQIGPGAGNYLTGLSGDVTASGPGTAAATLATVNSAPGACGDSTHVCQITTNGKGLVTTQAAVAVSGGSGGASSSTQLTDLGTTDTSHSATIAAGTWGIGNTTYSISGASVTINTLSVSAASNSSPITLTVNSAAGLHSGDTVVVSGVAGNAAANGTWTIALDNGTQIDLLGSTGNGSYTGGGTVAGTGSGVAYVEANDAGEISVYHSSSAGLILTCSGSCVANQMVSPAFDADAVPLSVITISGGAFTSVTDKRRFMSNRGITAGLGIAVTDSGGSASVAVDATVARTTGANVFTGSNTFSGGYILVPAGSQPTCNAANEGWFWYTKGSGSTSGSFQICQDQSGVFQWVTH